AQKALTVSNNDCATVLRCYELMGIIDATVGKKTALDHFRKLVSLDPDRTLSRDLGPRILSPFYEAKARLNENPPVRLEARSTLTNGSQHLEVEVVSDLQRLGHALRIHWRVGGEWTSKFLPLRPGAASVEVDGDAVDWYVQLLNSHDGVLVEAGSA